MVSRRLPNPVETANPASIPVLHSPLEKTPHKAGNGDLSITCRNRHCPKCQSQARDRWLDARRSELLATPYAHVVFTLPHQLAPLALQNNAVIYSLLFRCSPDALIEIAATPKYLGAEIGFFSVLHTWNQKLQHHPHVHCVVAAGGLSRDHTQWVRPPARQVLPPGWGSQQALPWEIRRRAPAGLYIRTAPVPWPPPRFVSAQTVSEFYPSAFCSALGGLLQTSVRRTRAGASLPRLLHTPRGDLQSPSRLFRR